MKQKYEIKALNIFIKYLPPFTALMYFVNSILSLCDIYISIISYNFYCGFIPLFLIYICCKVLKYCIYYKTFLLYIAVNNVINWLDYQYNFTENTLLGWIIVLGNFFIFSTYLLLKYLHKK